ncbi:DMT family transporter [Pseudothauera nasutitermitis]|uniref:DMT family transporter n=1 Tax=Pseudothauera nasutitermitis TaxID=2565930 RepID=A0A4S4B1K3_9RHOO|nr:DMT family transporter [Pseudothauera nasutitermitis]THF66396.1 DMT family transporter [Pseudothauera nasutitermitis]
MSSITTSRPIAMLCLASSMALVGSYVALSKPLAATFPVLLLAWLRFGIGGVAMLGWLKRPAEEEAMSGQTRRLLFLESFLGNFLFTICMITGVSLTNALTAGVVMASIPAVIALMSWGFLHERISPRTWIAIGCAVLGIALLAMAGYGGEAGGADDGSGGRALLGKALLLAAVVCEAAYSVIGKKLTGKLSAKRITALINLWGFALSTPFGLYFALRFDFGAVTPGVWVLLLFYALAACMWTVWLWMTGLKTIPAAQGGVFTVMLPISAALVGVLVLDETLNGTQLLALGVAVLGMLLATLPTRWLRAR